LLYDGIAVIFLLKSVDKMKLNHHILRLILAILILVSIITLLSYIGPSRIIGILGLENVYLTVFILAIIGGVSAFTAAGFYAALFSFALGGANPFILAAFSALGVLIGDFIFWYLGVEGRKAAEREYNSYLLRFSAWLGSKPKWLAPVIIYAYTGLTPFPGDFLMFVLAFLKYRFRQILVPTLLGNYTLALIVSMSAVWSEDIIIF